MSCINQVHCVPACTEGYIDIFRRNIKIFQDLNNQIYCPDCVPACTEGYIDIFQRYINIFQDSDIQIYCPDYVPASAEGYQLHCINSN